MGSVQSGIALITVPNSRLFVRDNSIGGESKLTATEVLDSPSSQRSGRGCDSTGHKRAESKELKLHFVR